MHHQSTPPRQTLHYGIVVLCLIVLTVFASLGLSRFGYTVILPAMQDSLDLTNTQAGELQSWNLGGYLVTVGFAGVLASRFGPRLVICVALFINATGMFLTGAVPTFEGAKVGRFLAGVGGAGGNVPAMGLVSSWFGGRRRGLAAGIAVAGSSLGLVLTGPLLPFVLRSSGPAGWPLWWFVLAGLTLTIAIICTIALRNRPQDLGLTPIGAAPGDMVAPGEKSNGSAGFAAICRVPVIWHLALIYFGFGFAYIIFSTFFFRYLASEAGFSIRQAGTLWMQVGFVSGASGLVWGAISDAWGRRLALAGVFLFQSTSYLLAGLSREAAVLYIAAGLFALTAWSVPALMAALAGDMFGARLAPAALGLLTIIFGIGQVLGPYLAGRIADAAHSLAPALLLAAGVSLVLGLGGTLFLHPSPTAPPSR